MTEFSWPWACDNIGDGGSASYTLDVVETTTRIRTNLDPTANGVIFWTDTTVLPFTSFVNASDGLLAPTNPSGNTIRISSGLGLVQGWLYANDDNVDFDATGAASATDIIVLRRDRSAQTVRLALVQAAASGTATVTQTAATWEVLIATITLDGSGNVSSITDSRSLVKPPVGSWTLIDTFNGDDATAAATFSSIPPLFSALKIIIYAKDDGSTPGSTMTLTFNNDTGSNYSFALNQFQNGATSYTESTGQTGINLGQVADTSSYFSTGEVLIANYANTVGYKSLLSRSTFIDNAASTDLSRYEVAGWWLSTAAINRVDLTINDPYVAGTIILVYGIV